MVFRGPIVYKGPKNTPILGDRHPSSSRIPSIPSELLNAMGRHSAAANSGLSNSSVLPNRCPRQYHWNDPRFYLAAAVHFSARPNRACAFEDKASACGIGIFV